MEKIYDDILKFYFAQGFLRNINKNFRRQFTGINRTEKIRNYLAPFVKLFKQEILFQRQQKQYLTTQNLKGKTWLFFSTSNNYNSLKFLTNELKDAILIGFGASFGQPNDIHLPFHRKAFYLWKYPKIRRFFKQHYGHDAVRFGDFLFNSVGLYEIAYKYLKKYQPKCLILANDHSERQRALLNAAQRLDIPVVYIQHASITHFMPPLDFDLSLLEGQDALDKYRDLGRIKGKVEFIGMPKFDKYLQFRKTSETITNIACCTNLLDTQKEIEATLKQLAAHFPKCQISFRPHPNDNRIFNLPDTIAVSTKSETSFDFILRQDVLIAGTSSIHLEAILLNVNSIYFEITALEENLIDAYGYVKNGLVEKAVDIHNLIEKIENLQQNNPPVFQKAKYYNAVVGTAYEGKSGILAAKYIHDFLTDWYQ